LSRAVRTALLKLLISTIVLGGLVLFWLSDVNGGLQGFAAVVVVILAFPITLLIAIDAARVIRREEPNHRSLRVLGRFLAFPQAILGTILMGFGAAYPVFGVSELIHDLETGGAPFFPIVRLVVAALMFVVGLRYFREGLGLKGRGR
jgi:hypothetical protein